MTSTPEASWFARRRDPDAARQTEEAFRSWLDADPLHAIRYEQCELAWERSMELRRDPDVTQWLDALDRQRARGVPTRIPGARRPLQRWAIAAGVMLAVGGLFAAWHLTAPVIYRTALGEQRMVLLADGSLATLNTATRIAVDYDRTGRRIELMGGEAVFDVKKDASRPFEVTAGESVARAVGTRFAVERMGNTVRVSVLEGVVSLRQAQTDRRLAAPSALPTLKIGEAATLRPDGRVDAVLPANVQRIRAWQDRKLDFDATPLQDAIAEVNRYSSKPLVLGRPELSHLHISGVFQIESLDGFRFALQQSFGLRVVEKDTELLIFPER